MGKPYSQDLRERVMAAVDSGTGAYVAAPLFRVSVSYIYKALIRRRVTGEVTARPSGGGPRPKLAPHDDALRARIAAEPDITLAELQAWLLAERQVTVSIGCLWNRLQFLDLPLKKVGASCRAGSAGRRRGSGGVACEPARAEPGTLGLHRRNGCGDRHGAPLWPLPARSASRLTRAVGALEDDDIRCRPARR